MKESYGPGPLSSSSENRVEPLSVHNPITGSVHGW